MLFYILCDDGERNRAPRAPQTRAAILDRAVDLASVEGLEGLTIGRLAAELGMSKSGLFAHFGSKQELQLATVDAAAERFRAAVIEPALGAPDGAPRLRAMGERYLDHLDALLRRLLLGRDLGRVRRPARAGPRRDRRRARRLAGGAGAPGRGSPASTSPSASPSSSTRVVMGANSRYRLSGDRRVFDYARDALER